VVSKTCNQLYIKAITKGDFYILADNRIQDSPDGLPSLHQEGVGAFSPITKGDFYILADNRIQAFSPCTSKIHLMICLPSVLYTWNPKCANCPRLQHPRS